MLSDDSSVRTQFVHDCRSGPYLIGEAKLSESSLLLDHFLLTLRLVDLTAYKHNEPPHAFILPVIPMLQEFFRRSANLRRGEIPFSLTLANVNAIVNQAPDEINAKLSLP